MTLEIDPKTEKGKTQLETIAWCQVQINRILEAFFANKYRLQKGLKIEFKIPQGNDFNESIKVDVAELAPESEERFKQAVEEAKSVMAFRVNKEPQVKDIPLTKITLPNATDFPVAKKEDKKDGSDQK